MASRTNRAIILFVCALLVALVAVTGWRVAGRLMGPPVLSLPTRALRVGIDISYAPFGTINAEGQPSGIDVSLAQAVADVLDVPLQIVPLGYDGLYDALLSGQVDLLISALVPNPNRTDRIGYSAPYFNAGLILVSDASGSVMGMDTLGQNRLAVAFGSEAHSEANRWLRRVPPFELLPFERGANALDAVRLGLAEAALVDSVTAGLYLREHPDWDVHRAILTVRPYSIATAVNSELTAAVNFALNDLMQRGEVQRIIDSYLG